MRVTIVFLSLLSCGSPVHGGASTFSEVIVEVGYGILEERLLLTGELDTARSLELKVPATEAWQMSIRWLADDGIPVHVGDKLLEFDNTAILEKIGELELAVAEAAVDLASQEATNIIAIEDKRIEVETQRIAVEKARLDVGIPESLQSRYDARKAALELTRAETALATAEEDLEAAKNGGRLDLEIKRIALNKAERALEDAERQLASLTIEAARDGVFVTGDHPWEGRKFQVGDMVWPGMTVAKLPELSEVMIEAVLNDVDDGRVRPGMRAVCTVDAFPEHPFAALVQSVSPVARAPSHQSSIRSFAVVLALEETDVSRMRPGLSVKVEVADERRERTLLVPRAALAWAGNQAQVRTVDGETKDVTIDRCDPSLCVVTAGLSPGDRIRASG